MIEKVLCVCVLHSMFLSEVIWVSEVARSGI